MPGPVYGQHFSVRIPDADAARFDQMAEVSGLKRSELLRLVILKAIRDGFSLVITAPDLRLARTIGAPSGDAKRGAS